MKVKELSGGIDIGSEFHHVIVINDEGEVLYDKKVLHRFSKFNEAVRELKAMEKRTRGKIAFGLEGKNGYGAPFDRILGENGFSLYNIDNLKLKQFRNTFGAEWKTDRRDAKMLAKLISLKAQFNGDRDKVFIPIEKVPLVHEKLKLLSRHQETLINEKKRICNRLGKKLLEICPGILDIVGKVDSKTLLRILVCYPNFSGYRKLTKEKLLRIKGIGKVRASKIINHLQSLEYVKELVGIYAEIIQSQAKRIMELKEEIELLDKRLDKLGEGSKEVKRLRSIPGVGTKISSRLVGEIGDIKRFRNANKLAIYCGVGCVNNDSGKRNMAKSVFKANKICKATMIDLAGCTIQRISESRRYYEKKKNEGKNHNHALRCLARQMIKVIFKLLIEDRDYCVREES
jgi:transposase